MNFAVLAAIAVGAVLASAGQARAQPSDWTLTKTANPTTYTAAGQTITYTYVVTDTYGSTGVLDSLTDDKVTTINCPSTTVNGTLTCTGTYTTTAADVTAGSVTNKATASGDACSDGCGRTATAQATIRFVPHPSWTLRKTPSPTTYSAAGQTINYSYVLTNTGNVSISTISLSDDKVAPLSCPAATLAAGASMTCTGAYTTTAADLTAGSVTNTATATGTPAFGTLGSVTAQATITRSGSPSWTLTKSASPTTYTAAGQAIAYSYALTNTGNVSISTISLSDDKVAPLSCPAATLAAGASMTCTGAYTTTAADLTAGSVTNTATATGTPAFGTLGSVTAQATITRSGSPSWTLTKSASPTTYTAAGQAIAYSYALTNTGQASISAISLTDNKVSPVSCPATALAAGASMTCTGSYTTTAADVANRSVSNTATATGTPAFGALPTLTAQVTITYTVTNGSITIIKTAVGLDGAFSFTSSVAGAASFLLTTANGTASRTFSNLTAGSYSFTEVGLPPEWKLTALSCTGDTGGAATTVNLGNRAATVGLDAAESITCTFTNTFDVAQHRAETQQVIARFLAHRLSLLIGEEPDRPRFLGRVPGSLWGSSSGSNGSSQPLSFTGSTTAFGDRFNFATSLGQVMRAQANADRDEIGGALGYAKMPTKARPRLAPEPVIDAWVEAHYSSFRASNGGVDNGGQFGIVYLGADYLATPNLLLGALVQFDWMKENSNTLVSAVDGHGTMAGPYVSLRLSPDIFFDSRFAWGISANNVNPFGYYTDDFSTDRWLAHAKLTGNWRWDDFRITPSVAVDYAQEHQRDYSDTLGVPIPGQTVSLGRLSFGPEIARRFTGNDGATYEPLAALIGQWDFSKTDLTAVSGLPVGSDSFHAKVQAGLLARAPSGLSARLVGSYDGIGSSSFHAIGAEIWLSIPLN